MQSRRQDERAFSGTNNEESRRLGKSTNSYPIKNETSLQRNELEKTRRLAN